MRILTYRTVILALNVFAVFLLNACTATDIIVTKTTPQRSISGIEEFNLPNCGGTDRLAYTLGTQVTVQKSVSVANRASAQAGAEIEIPAVVQASLQAEVERSYVETYSATSSRLNQIEMGAAATTKVIYIIQWEEQKYTSFISFYYSGSYYQTPYVYTLLVPKIADSRSEPCPTVTPYQVAQLVTSTVKIHEEVGTPIVTKSTPTPQQIYTVDLATTESIIENRVQRAVNATLTAIASIITPSPTNTPTPTNKNTPTLTYTPRSPTSTSTPTRRFTPTATATLTPNAIATAHARSAFSDDFDDTKFDGSVNTKLWSKQFTKECIVAQQDGVMILKNENSNSGVYCDLIINHNAVRSEIFASEIGTIESRMKFGSDYSGTLVNNGIRVSTPGWYAFCGLASDNEGVMAVFDTGWQIDEWEYVSPANAEQWYTLRLEIDPATMKVSCFVNGNVLGEVIPEKASQLKDKMFSREMASFRSQSSSATTYIDYCRIIPRKH